jgi:uncharacterized DUF497 family protein
MNNPETQVTLGQNTERRNGLWFMLFNATFNDISVISWRRSKEKTKQTYKQKQKNTIPVEKPRKETQ